MRSKNKCTNDSASFLGKSGKYCVARLATSCNLRYCSLNHLALFTSNLAPALLIRSNEKADINSSNENNSCSVPGFQPKKARKLIIAAGRYPSCLKPFEITPVCGSFHSKGKTGNPPKSASLLESFPFPSGFKSKGKWANCGGCQPKAWYNNICNGADGSHSSPRITCVISIIWSSTTFAK